MDRSATYAARHVAKNVVAAGLADEVVIQVAYAIGMADPVAVDVDTFGTGRLSDDRIVEVVRDLFDLRPGAIIDRLKLARPIYRPTATYGHFGREGFSWEALDYVDALRAEVGELV